MRLRCSPSTAVGMKRYLRRIAVPLLAIAAAGCSSPYEYLYEPAEQASASVNGMPAARYAIPPESPRGDVRIASLGFTEISEEDAPFLRVLHVRMIVSNDSGAGPWTVDTRAIRLELRGERVVSTPYINTDEPGMPLVQIPPGRQRTIDLFFPLPKGMDEPEDVQSFDITWRVQTDTRDIVERTPFERLAIERVRPQTEMYPGFAPYWWYDPWYVRPGAAVVVRANVTPRVIVRRPPRWR